MTVMLHHGSCSLSVKKVLEITKVCINGTRTHLIRHITSSIFSPDHVISLQKCVGIERQHADFWTMLADGYRLLQANCSGLLQSSTTPSNDGGSTSANVEQLTVSDQLGDILGNTVSLFRPYFSWRDIKMNQLLITEDELLDSDESTTNENTARMKSDLLDSEKSEKAWCHKDCPFFTHSHSSSTESSSYCCFYRTAVGGLATPNLTLCLLHSPFVFLTSRQVTIEEFMELLKSITKSRSIELLRSFCTMAECSCYLWARYVIMT